MTGMETFLWGAFGGLAAEVASVFALRHRLPAEAPHFLTSWLYYILALCMTAIGGAVAVAYQRSGSSLNPLLAMQIGASAPLLIRKLSESVVETPKVSKGARVN